VTLLTPRVPIVVSPGPLAAARLRDRERSALASSNLVGCSTGRSAGLAYFSILSLDHIPTQLQIGRSIDGATPLATTAVHNCFRRDFRCPSVPFATIEDDPDIAPVPKVMAQFCVSVEAAARDDDKEHRRSSAAGSPMRSRRHYVGDILRQRQCPVKSSAAIWSEIN
jgi:hypothetical protein